MPTLVQGFCARFITANGRPELNLNDEAIGRLSPQRWPGNVREREDFVERLVVLSNGPNIGKSDVKRELQESPGGPPPTAISIQTQQSLASVVAPLAAAVRRSERRALLKAMEHTGDNRTLAAGLLGIKRGTLYRKLSNHVLK